MKKLVLIASTLVIGLSVHAQSLRLDGNSQLPHMPIMPASGYSGQKATKNGDTILKRNYLSTDSAKLYIGESVAPIDSGYVAGTNAWGDKGFAERFDITSPDSSVLPLGVAVYFHGRATATSAKAVLINAWNQGPTTGITGRPHLFFTGVPTTVVAGCQLSVPIKALRQADGSIDSFGLFRFSPNPTTYVSDSFFVGYSINYSWSAMAGDTITAYMTKNGQRHTPGYVVKGADTIVENLSMTQASTGTWTDNLNGGRFGIYNNYLMYALFRVKTLGVNGIGRQDLTVYGTYPNPATNSATLKLSLKSATSVSVRLMDMSGRIVYTAAPKQLGAGTHELPIETSALAAGTYYCLINTAAGDKLGIEMTVIK